MDRPKQLTGYQLLYRAAWPLALMGTIIWASGTQGPVVPGALSFPHLDKVVHFFAFGLIATLVYRALPHWLDRRKAAVLAVLVAALFGVGDEFRQSFNPQRFTDFWDWVMDICGAAVAVTVYRFWPFYRNLLETSVNPFKRKDRHGG